MYIRVVRFYLALLGVVLLCFRYAVVFRVLLVEVRYVSC